MALPFRPYDDQSGQETRARWANSLDGIFNQYMASKAQAQAQGLQQRQLADADGAQLASQGFLNRQVTPDVVAAAGLSDPMAARGTGMAPKELEVAMAFRAYKEKRDKEQGLKLRGAEAGLANTEADTALKLANAGAKAGEGGRKAEGDLRGELQNLSKPFVLVRDSMGRIEASAKDPSAAGDLALIFNYMKVLDPGSTVREGEFATAQNSAGLDQRIVSQYNKVLRGERLAPDQRQDFLSRARELYKSQESIQRQVEGQYKGLAERYGAKPENVILNQGLPQPAPGGKIRVSNGRETLLIDASDEADAAKDGYKRAS